MCVPLLIVILGCTSPTQKIANKSLEIASKQHDSIVVDLSKIAKQKILDAMIDAKGDSETITELFNENEKVVFLQIQNERANALIRLTQLYIGSQQGILDIVSKELEGKK